MTNYVKLAIALLKGDKAEVTMLRNERLSQQALKGQISALEGKKINQEIDVERCKDNVKNAILNIHGEEAVLISSSEAWINNVKSAKNALKDSEDKLEEIDASIEEWTAMMNGEYYQQAVEE